MPVLILMLKFFFKYKQHDCFFINIIIIIKYMLCMCVCFFFNFVVVVDYRNEQKKIKKNLFFYSKTEIIYKLKSIANEFQIIKIFISK